MIPFWYALILTVAFVSHRLGIISDTHGLLRPEVLAVLQVVTRLSTPATSLF